MLLGTVGLVLLGPGATPAASATLDCPNRPMDPPPHLSGDDPRALLLLQQTMTAMTGLSYSGTQMITAWGRGEVTSAVLDVNHVAGQGTLVRVRGGAVGDGAPTFLADIRSSSPQIGELGISSLELLASSYDVSLTATGQVSGREASVVDVSRGGRPMARMWVDTGTGLLLRREVFDGSGRLVGESVFLDVMLGERSFIEHLPPAEPDEGARSLGLQARGWMEQAGWHVSPRIATLALVDIAVLADAEAVHLSYSDGLFRVSVFEQRGPLDADALDGFTRADVAGRTAWVRQGIPSYVVWEGDGIVYTAVSDAPVSMLTRLMPATPPPTAESPGFWSRVGAGLSQMSAWISPLT